VPIVQLTKGVRAHKVVCVSSWKLSLCVVYLFFACLVLSPDLGEIVSLSLLSRFVPQVSLVMLTRLVVAE